MKTLSLVAASFFMVTATPALANCDAYLSEAQSVSGAVPRFSDDGRIEAIMAYGEATFFANKASLISTARKKAELDAKRNFSSWLNESVAAETAAQSMLEQVEATNERGETAGVAVELTRVIDTMRSDTKATIQGMTKLDECVDPDKGIVLVTFGWKPGLTEMIGQAHSESAATTATAGRSDQRQKARADAAGCQSAVTTITVEVDGFGMNQNTAINDALRLAVGQVHGERFAASLASLSADLSVQATNNDGDQKSVAVSSQAQAMAVASQTEGLIESYSIIDKVNTGDGQVQVQLQVNLPKFKPSTCESSKQKIVITLPNIMKGRQVDPSFAQAREMMHRELESLLDGTKQLTVLNRQNIQALDAEAANMQRGDFSITEQAKLGNRVGADLIVVTEISDFEVIEQEQQAGRKIIRTTKMRGQAWIRVIDLATTNTVFSVRVPVQAVGGQEQIDPDYFALSMARQLAVTVGDSVGGGFNAQGARQLRQVEKKEADYELAVKRVDEQMDKLEKEVESKW